MPSKLYVGNLPFSVTGDDLAEYFSQVGTVEKAVVVTDKFSGQSRGFGFVEMADQESAEKAVQSLNGTDFKGRTIKIDHARENSAPRRSGPGGGGGGGRRGPGGGRGNGGGRHDRW
jgi:RNA recognition motif-containing protein